MKRPRVEAWGASVRGPSHVKNGLPNQDAFLVRQFPWGAVAVVSDGLGSRPHSDRGSKAACRAVLKTFLARRKAPGMRDEDFLALLHAHWIRELFPLAIEECSATCLFACVMDEVVFVGRLGDGLVGILESGGSLLLQDEKDDHFSNQTDSLGRSHASRSWQIIRRDLSACRFVFLCTDGVSSDLEPGMEASFIESLGETSHGRSRWRNGRDAKRWLEQWPVKGHSDDKTVALLEVMQ